MVTALREFIGFDTFLLGVIFQYDEQHTNVSVEMKFYISWSGIAWGTPLSKSFKGCEIFFLKREKERESRKCKLG